MDTIEPTNTTPATCTSSRALVVVVAVNWTLDRLHLLVLEEVVVEVVERLGGGLLDDVRVGHLVVGLVELHGPVDDGAGLALGLRRRRLGRRGHLQRDLEVLVEVNQLAVHHAVRHHLVLVVRHLQLLLGERQHRHRCNTSDPRDIDTQIRRWH